MKNKKTSAKCANVKGLLSSLDIDSNGVDVECALCLKRRGFAGEGRIRQGLKV